MYSFLRYSKLSIILSFLLILPAISYAHGGDHSIEEQHVSSKVRNYKIRGMDLEMLENQTVKIPAKQFTVWHAMRENVPFEVGGGLDFNIYRQLERIKLSTGMDTSVGFVVDFEVSWHTHPNIAAYSNYAFFAPPSPSDILVALYQGYNFYNLLNFDGKHKINFKSRQEDISRPTISEVGIVLASEGVYIYRPNKKIWTDKYSMPSKSYVKYAKDVKAKLQLHINKVYNNLQNGTYTVEQARKFIVDNYKITAGLELDFKPWREVLKNGLDLKLDVVELLQKQKM